jgi:hypothetical protein
VRWTPVPRSKGWALQGVGAALALPTPLHGQKRVAAVVPTPLPGPDGVAAVVLAPLHGQKRVAAVVLAPLQWPDASGVSGGLVCLLRGVGPVSPWPLDVDMMASRESGLVSAQSVGHRQALACALQLWPLL